MPAARQVPRGQRRRSRSRIPRVSAGRLALSSIRRSTEARSGHAEHKGYPASPDMWHQTVDCRREDANANRISFRMPGGEAVAFAVAHLQLAGMRAR